MKNTVYDYNLFMLANRHICFHPGGVFASLGLVSQIPGLDKTKTVILDYGCGNGFTLIALAKLGFENLVGYDHSKELIHQNKISEDNKKFNIRFFSDFDEMMRTVKKADVLLLESVCSYINNDAEQSFIETINEMSHALKIKYVGINDFYQYSTKSDALLKIISTVFGIKKLREKNELLKLISGIKRTQEPKILLELSYVIDNNLPLNPELMTSNLIGMYPTQNGYEAKLKNYFVNYAEDMNRAFQLFKPNFKYLSILIKT